jgi:hypothetical protein
MEEPLEGWYTDPYARHEARWISQGVATDLVRDGSVEGRDPAPDSPFAVTPIPCEESSTLTKGADLRRADEAEQSSIDGGENPEDGAWNAAGENMA